METDGLELNNITGEDDLNTTRLKIEKPRKVLHFSDGVMEEYSDVEDECDAVLKKPEECASTKDLAWAPYMRLKANKMGSNVLAGVDFVGGGLASFLGITTSEVELAAGAASRVIKVKENTDEEPCGTWNAVRDDAVISEDVKKSIRIDTKSN